MQKLTDVQKTVQNNLNIELTKLLYEPLLVSLATVFILASLLAWGVRDHVNHEYLFIWYIALVISTLFRLILAIVFRFTQNKPELQKMHYWLFMISSTMFAALWGVMNSFLMPNNLADQVLVIIIVAGIMAGSVQAFQASFLIFTLYLTFTILPLIIWLFLQKQELYFIIGITMVIYLFFTLIAGYRGNIMVIKNLKLRYENIDLLKDLSTAKAELENINKNLKLELGEHKTAEERLNYLATHDDLTGLYNRNFFYAYFTQAVSRTKRNNAKLALLYADIDRFKQYNDTYGHEFGDQILIHVATQLKKLTRTSDLVVRLGGDEFVVLLEEIDQMESVKITANNICEKMAKEFNLENHPVHLTISIGISIYPTDSVNIEDLLKEADMAMYSSKSSGGNTYRFYKHIANLSMRK